MEIISFIVACIGVAVLGLGFLGGLINMINIIEGAIEDKRQRDTNFDARISRLEDLNRTEAWTNTAEEDDRK